MFFFADSFDKALLSLGVSIGFATSDFLDLRYSEIEKLVDYSIANKEEFPHLDYYRGKTNVRGRAFLIPEAVKCLKNYFQTTEPDENDRLFNLSPDALNDHLKVMVYAAGVKTRGRIKWHLLRKFLFSGLLKAMDHLSAKLVLGKRLSADLLTYMLEREETLRIKFRRAYPYIRLAENGDRLRKAEEDLTMYRKLFRKIIIDSGLLKDVSPDLSDEDVLRLYLKR